MPPQILGNSAHECTGDSACRRERRGSLAALSKRLAAALDRSRQRRALATLSDAMLHDIGLTRRQVDAESRRPFWR
jgi:uncharacterized protein YjiS (DUF1127 family)